MPEFIRKKILVLHAQQPWNQYAGGGVGQPDSEQAWMRKLAVETADMIREAGHEVLLSPVGSSYADNVKWVNAQTGVDFLLSLHSNATGKSEAAAKGTVGVGVYHHPNSSRGKQLAISLLPFMRAASAAGKAYVGTLTVAELASTRPPALLIENEYHDWQGTATTGGADWVRSSINRYRLAKAYRDWVVSLYGAEAATPPPPVVITPPKPTVTGLNVATYNCLDPRFGGKVADDVAVLKAAAASVHLLTECPESVRDAIRAGMTGGPDRWKVWPRVPQAILFDSSKWQSGPASEVKPVTFGPTSYHGGVIVVLTSKKTGLKVQFGVLHLPPSNVSDELERRRYLTRFIAALTPNMPTVIGGDFNSRSAGDWLKAAGFDVLDTGGTNDKGRRLDYLAVRNGLHWVAPAEIFNPGAASDHLAVKGKCRTVPATNTL